RFMPRPRNSTEMRPSMPARKRCPFLKSGLFSYASRLAVLFPPHCGMHTTLTPSCLHDFTFCSLKKPRSEPYSCGACPKLSLWRCREGELRARPTTRSEEHTSELQSRVDLVCRLLLEKKKNRHVQHTSEQVWYDDH